MRPARAVFIGCLGACFATETSPPVNPQPQPDHKKYSATTLQPAFLGITMEELDEALEYHLKLSHDLGILVHEVSPNSPAEKMGVKTYDVVVKCDGQDMYTPRALSNLIAAKKAGDSITIEIRRGAESVSLSGELQARPAQLDDLDDHQPNPQSLMKRFRNHQFPPEQDSAKPRQGTIKQPDGSIMEWSIEEPKTP